MADHVITLVTFTETSRAYESFSDLRRAAGEERLGIRAAALVEREADGTIRVAEGEDQMIGGAAVGGGIIAELDEVTPEVLDGIVLPQGGTVLRYDDRPGHPSPHEPTPRPDRVP